MPIHKYVLCETVKHVGRHTVYSLIETSAYVWHKEKVMQRKQLKNI